jgi:hydroxymethylpyrimidine pyrophosphatase-like HAD family hydrolase
MPYYKEKNLLFIHIPKTGGTIVEDNIKKQASQKLFSGRTNTLLNFPYNQKSLQHQFYTTIYKYRDKLNINFDKIKIFTIVRNPYDRIISDLFWNGLIKKDFTAEQVYNIIKNNYLDRDDLDNHNEPQYKFIVDENSELIKNIKIFRTETLNQSNDELSKFVGFNINIRKKGINKDYSNYLNKDSITLINIFYKKDFELFNYKLESAF